MAISKHDLQSRGRGPFWERYCPPSEEPDLPESDSHSDTVTDLHRDVAVRLREHAIRANLVNNMFTYGALTADSRLHRATGPGDVARDGAPQAVCP